MIFAAIADWADSKSYDLRFMCEQLGVSTSGHYKWRQHTPSARERENTRLTRLLTTLYHSLKGNPGVRCLHAELAAAGHNVSRKRVWGLMRAAGL